MEQEVEVTYSAQSQSTGKRGRPAIPEKWTQVISLDKDNLDSLKTHIIANDLMLMTGFQAGAKGTSEEVWNP